jgi:hypothetical protein
MNIDLPQVVQDLTSRGGASRTAGAVAFWLMHVRRDPADEHACHG